MNKCKVLFLSVLLLIGACCPSVQAFSLFTPFSWARSHRKQIAITTLGALSAATLGVAYYYRQSIVAIAHGISDNFLNFGKDPAFDRYIGEGYSADFLRAMIPFYSCDTDFCLGDNTLACAFRKAAEVGDLTALEVLYNYNKKFINSWGATIKRGLHSSILLDNSESYLSNDSGSALYFAIKYGNEACVDFLLKNKAVVDDYDLYVAARCCDSNIFEKIRGKFGRFLSTAQKNSIFNGLCEAGDLDAVKKFIQEEQPDPALFNPLHYAVRNKVHGAKIIEFLLSDEGGCKDLKKKNDLINKLDKDGNPPLFYFGNEEILDTLLKHGADINAKNSKKNTVLHEMSELLRSKESPKCFKKLQLLVDYGADVNVTNSADINVTNNDGFTPIDTLILRIDLNRLEKEAYTFLIENGARIASSAQKFKRQLSFGEKIAYQIAIDKKYSSPDLIRIAFGKGDLTALVFLRTSDPTLFTDTVSGMIGFEKTLALPNENKPVLWNVWLINIALQCKKFNLIHAILSAKDEDSKEASQILSAVIGFSPLQKPDDKDLISEAKKLKTTWKSVEKTPIARRVKALFTTMNMLKTGNFTSNQLKLCDDVAYEIVGYVGPNGLNAFDCSLKSDKGK